MVQMKTNGALKMAVEKKSIVVMSKLMSSSHSSRNTDVDEKLEQRMKLSMVLTMRWEDVAQKPKQKADERAVALLPKMMTQMDERMEEPDFVERLFLRTVYQR